MTDLVKLWNLASDSRVCNVIVHLNGAKKVYKVCNGDKVAELNGETEEKIFLLFKYPEVYCDEIGHFLVNNENLFNEYVNNPEKIRNYLRETYKDKLFSKAREILGSNVKKSRGINTRKLKHTTQEKEVSDKDSKASVVEEPIKPTIMDVKPIHKSKTILFNTSVIVSGLILVLQGIKNNDSNLIVQGLSVLFVGIVNWILRLITKKPIKV
jgi:hypothetical protein